MNKIQNYLEKTNKEFEKEFSIANFTWKEGGLGEKFAKQSRNKLKQFLRSRQLGLIELIRSLTPKKRFDSDAWADDDHRSIFNDGFNSAREQFLKNLEYDCPCGRTAAGGHQPDCKVIKNLEK